MVNPDSTLRTAAVGPSSPGARTARLFGQSAAAKAEIIGERDSLPPRPLEWFLLMVVAGFVGAAAGLLGGEFRVALAWLNFHRAALVLFSHTHYSPWVGWAIPTTLCAAAAGLGSWMTQRWAPQTAGSGISRIEEVLRYEGSPAATRIIPVKFIGLGETPQDIETFDPQRFIDALFGEPQAVEA